MSSPSPVAIAGTENKPELASHPAQLELYRSLRRDMRGGYNFRHRVFEAMRKS